MLHKRKKYLKGHMLSVGPLCHVLVALLILLRDAVRCQTSSLYLNPFRAT